jgi:hypothetical protein
MQSNYIRQPAESRIDFWTGGEQKEDTFRGLLECVEWNNR